MSEVVPIDDARRRHEGPAAARVPPNNTQAEASLLGAMLLRSDAIGAAVDSQLAADDFYKPAHAHVFDAILGLYAAGEPCDPVTVAEALSRAGHLEAIGGAATLITLQADTPSIGSAGRYARIIGEHATLRRLVKVAGDLADLGYSLPADVQGAVDTAEELVFDLRPRSQVPEAHALVDVLYDWLGVIEARVEAGGAIESPMGWADLDAKLGGLHPGRLMIVAARPGVGKAQPINTPVLTPGGWRAMGTIQVDDWVMGVDGNPARVLGVYDQGELPVFRVKLSDRTSTRACGDHLWLVRTHHDRIDGKPGSVSTTAEIRDDLDAGRNRHHHLPVVAPVAHPTASLPIDPYLLGVLIGDGCFRNFSPTFTSIDEEMHEAVVALVPHPVVPKRLTCEPITAILGCGNTGGRLNPLTDALRGLGLYRHLSIDKFIPPSYLHADVAQRLALLQGIMDTDGWYVNQGSQFSSASEQLAKDVAELARSLGGTARVSFKRNAYAGCWNVCLRIATGLCPFRLERKRMLWEKDRAKAIYPPDRKIVAVEPDGMAHCVCLRVDGPDELYVTEDHIVTHNTSWVSQLALNVAGPGGRPVLFISIEMGREELAGRMVASSSGLVGSSMSQGDVAPRDWDRIGQSMGRLGELAIDIVDTTPVTLLSVRAGIRRAIQRHGRLGLVVIDYVQLMTGRRAENRQVEVAEVVRGLKLLSKEMAVPVVALAQLSRNLEQRADKRPTLADLRESGELENSADQVVFIYRDEVYNSQSSDRGIAELIIGKNRHGPDGIVRVAADMASGRWHDLSRREEV